MTENVWKMGTSGLFGKTPELAGYRIFSVYRARYL